MFNLLQCEILSKDAGPFVNLFFFFRHFSHILAIANHLPGFSIKRLANDINFLNVNIFLSLNLNVTISDHSFNHICIVCYLKLHFYCLPYSAMSNLN